ncbi:MAG TPA: 5'-3' exonuclease H3TH domain-containing protein [Thermoanaerobaculia bacterium]|nr:5'-3' exonuclease H3TH domain-containing protein [Thermoanaerobaculia bacterium]
MPTVHLIDASPYLFRAFFSVPRSVRMNAVYGFSGFLTKYIDDARPTHLAVAFDRHFNQSFRNEYYPPYKAHRDPSPPELDAQVDPCLALVEALGIAAFIDERHEADDLIATIIRQTEASDVRFVIVSTDKDLTQLVSERVTLVDPGRGLRFDPAGVEAKFGVRPDQITDFLGLAGDAVDNIPGVRGIGPKTAAQLLKRHGSLEGIFEHRAATVTSPAGIAKFKEDAELAVLSKRLATVADDAPISVTLDALLYRGAEDARALSRDYLTQLKK